MTPDEINLKNLDLLRAYKLVFGAREGRAALADLERFCRGNTSCFHPDPRMHAVLEGRREVWLRIQKFKNMTPEEIPTEENPDELAEAVADERAA